jgi:hypothetical protein
MFTASIRNLEEALIQLQYALGDYRSRGKQDCDARLGPLDASLCVLREASISAQVEISLLGASPEIAGTDHKEAIFQYAAGQSWHERGLSARADGR